MQKLFGSATIGYDEWLLILSVAMSIHLIVGLEKLLRRHF
jgi:Ca2+-transporting ATPase